MILAIPVPLIAAIIGGVVELAKIIRDIWTADGRKRIADRKLEKTAKTREQQAREAVDRFNKRHGRKPGQPKIAR